jgi:hypothetical protein
MLYIDKDGKRWSAEQLEARGASGLEAELGYREVSDVLPAGFDPLFDIAIDIGTSTEEGASGPSVTWRLGHRPTQDIRQDLLAKLAERRWQAETAGTSVGGQMIETDRESRGSLVGAAVRADMALRDGEAYAVRWKLRGGFIDLDASAVIAAAKTVEAYVRACYAHEAELMARIEDAVDVAGLRSIDIETGWPGAPLNSPCR